MARQIKSWLGATVAAFSALGCVRVFALGLGFVVKINTFTLLLAGVLGVPGVVLMLLLRLVFEY